MNLNKAIIVGRVAAEPETRTTQSGQSVTSFRVATNRVWNDRTSGQKQEQVEYHTIVAWAGLADVVSKYLAKGQLVQVEGRIQTRSWEGNDGVKRYRTEIVAENLQLGPKASGASAGSYSGSGAPRATAAKVATSDKDANAQEEDIPIIDADSPTSGVSESRPSEKDVEESEIDLKDIPF